MNALPRFVFGLLLFGQGVGAAVAAAGESERQQVLDFCERFAERAPENLPDARGGHYLEQSAAVQQRLSDHASALVANLFQPLDSRFLGVWHCSFQLVVDGKTCDGEVSLPVAEHQAFAEHTQWPQLMFVRNNQLTDPDGAAAGYITPKYDKLNCPRDGERDGKSADKVTGE